MADSAFSARGAARPLKTPHSRPGHDVLFRAWITTTRHSAGSARSPQSSSCSRWRLSEGCSTVPPGRAATAIPSLPTARRPPRHRRRSAVRSVGESRSGRCAGSFASSHNWLKRGQSPTRLWGTGAQSRRNAVRQLPFEGMRRRRRPCVRGSLSTRPGCSSAHSIPGSLPRRALQVAGSPTFCASVRLRWLRDAPRVAIQRCWRSGRPASIVRSGSEPCRARTPLFRVAIHKIDYRALLARQRRLPPRSVGVREQPEGRARPRTRTPVCSCGYGAHNFRRCGSRLRTPPQSVGNQEQADGQNLNRGPRPGRGYLREYHRAPRGT